MKLNEYIEKYETMITGMQTNECKRVVSEAKRLPKSVSAAKRSKKWNSVEFNPKKTEHLASKKKIKDPTGGYKREKLKGIKDIEVDEGGSGKPKQIKRAVQKTKKLSKKKDVHKYNNSDKDTKRFASSGKVHDVAGYNRNKLKPVKHDEEVDESPKKGTIPQKPKDRNRNPVQKNMYKTGKPGVHDADKKAYNRKEEKKKNPDINKLRDQVRTASIYD